MSHAEIIGLLVAIFAVAYCIALVHDARADTKYVRDRVETLMHTLDAVAELSPEYHKAFPGVGCRRIVRDGQLVDITGPSSSVDWDAVREFNRKRHEQSARRNGKAELQRTAAAFARAREAAK